MSDSKTSVDFNGFSVGAVAFLFFIFWLHSGWYRVDCALKVKPACDLIDAEYKAKSKP